MQTEKEQKAHFIDHEKYGYAQNARHMGNEKELVRDDTLVFFDSKAKEIRIAVHAFFWMGRSSSASTVYCSVWITKRDGQSVSGRGSAGGWGYDKESAALHDAIESAGVRLERSIHGVGDYAMREAMLAIALAAGYRKTMPHRFI